MVKKYRAWYGEIDKIAIIRETEKTVVLPGRGSRVEVREAKRSDYQNWFDTWDDAKAFLVAGAEKEVDQAKARLERAKGKLGQVRGLRPAYNA